MLVLWTQYFCFLLQEPFERSVGLRTLCLHGSLYQLAQQCYVGSAPHVFFVAFLWNCHSDVVLAFWGCNTFRILEVPFKLNAGLRTLNLHDTLYQSSLYQSAQASVTRAGELYTRESICPASGERSETKALN